MKSEKEVLISLQNVGVVYRRLLRRSSGYWALKDVSFDVLKGETLGVIGGNGAGKSTLMRILAGLITPDVGKIVSGDISAQLLSLQLGFDRHLSGRENVIVSGMLLGKRRKEMLALLPSIIEFSGLHKFIDEPVKTYSSGMSARLGFAISSHADPDVLLIDEVLGVGDQAFKEKSTALMKARIASEQTVVIVSHQQNTLKELCDRLVWVEDGKTREQGEPDKVIESYLTYMKSSK
jgi:lipopolysaccharide transport system ATP-binding protein